MNQVLLSFRKIFSFLLDFFALKYLYFRTWIILNLLLAKSDRLKSARVHEAAHWPAASAALHVQHRGRIIQFIK